MDEVKLIWDRIKDTNNATAFMIALKLGLRAGEIYALRWSDIDFKDSTANITKQLQFQQGKWSFTTLKTANSYRKIKFDNEFKEYLLEVKQKQDEFRSLLGDMYKSNKVYNTLEKNENNNCVICVNDFINVKPDGEMLNTNSPKVITRICKEDFGIDFKIHNLRHTHATILLEKGQNPKYISERLGHSNASFTLKLYTHLTRAMDDSALDALNFKL